MLKTPTNGLFLGQGACQSIESGFALAQILAHWKSPDAAAAFQFFQDFRKPRTDKITRTSAETGKMASADIPEEMWKQAFSPEVVHERMRWVMEYDLLAELSEKLGAVRDEKSAPTSESESTRADQELTPLSRFRGKALGDVHIAEVQTA